jgi:CBS domain-containing protein
MSKANVGSIVVSDDMGAPIGIVTDRDLRHRVIAAPLPPETAVHDVMSSPLCVIEDGRLAIEALIEMTRRGIHHLGVVESDRGRLLGMISSHDLLGLQAAHPVALAREIERAATLDALAGAASRLIDVVRGLARGGAGAIEIGQVVSELNDRVVRGSLALVVTELGREAPPPGPYSWVVAGSEGRREQTMKTDQDNGLVYADPSPADAPAYHAYFRRLGLTMAEALSRLGFPPCAGGFMASNPRWCGPLAQWRAEIESWMAAPQPERLVAASVFCDMRTVAGDVEPGRGLGALIRERAPASPLFLRFMARDALARAPALDLLGRLAVQRRGAHRGMLDLKGSALLPITQAARVYALSLGTAETNTLDRLQVAETSGALPPAESRDLRDAYAVLSRLRLQAQLDALAAGRAPDNWIDPVMLPRTDRVLMKEALKAVAWLQRLMEDRFQTNLVS